ncbi:MAG TPA: hypothetical protein VND15_00465 [Candidatus Acidoferrales bacterium]|nr:hypothetical protein [Candidatus Acidoferrales bacterium]
MTRKGSNTAGISINLVETSQILLGAKLKPGISAKELSELVEIGVSPATRLTRGMLRLGLLESCDKPFTNSAYHFNITSDGGKVLEAVGCLRIGNTKTATENTKQVKGAATDNMLKFSVAGEILRIVNGCGVATREYIFRSADVSGSSRYFVHVNTLVALGLVRGEPGRTETLRGAMRNTTLYHPTAKGALFLEAYNSITQRIALTGDVHAPIGSLKYYTR